MIKENWWSHEDRNMPQRRFGHHTLCTGSAGTKQVPQKLYPAMSYGLNLIPFYDRGTK
jgi:hypothetical protein